MEHEKRPIITLKKAPEREKKESEKGDSESWKIYSRSWKLTKRSELTRKKQEKLSVVCFVIQRNSIISI